MAPGPDLRARSIWDSERLIPQGRPAVDQPDIFGSAEGDVARGFQTPFFFPNRKVPNPVRYRNAISFGHLFLLNGSAPWVRGAAVGPREAPAGGAGAAGTGGAGGAGGAGAEGEGGAGPGRAAGTTVIAFNPPVVRKESVCPRIVFQIFFHGLDMVFLIVHISSLLLTYFLINLGERSTVLQIWIA